MNSVLIKLNQIGTLTETIEAIALARGAGWSASVAIAPARPRTRRSPTSSWPWAPARSSPARRRGPSGSPSTTACCASRVSSATAPVPRPGGAVGSAVGDARRRGLEGLSAVVIASSTGVRRPPPTSGSGRRSRSSPASLLIIPIEWLIWLLAIPAGLTIGYYANQRSDRRPGRGAGSSINGAVRRARDRAVSMACCCS